MKPISEKIELARQLFAAGRLKKKAGKLFLGKTEQEQLIQLAAQMQSVFIYSAEGERAVVEGTFFSGTHDRRLEFRGMKVYCVDDLEYCEVAE